MPTQQDPAARSRYAAAPKPAATPKPTAQTQRSREAFPTVQLVLRISPELREDLIGIACDRRSTLAAACRVALQAAVDTHKGAQ